MSADTSDVLHVFHPATAEWFRTAFDAPSPAQETAWPVISRGENTLLLAPTGSGKTLAAFLCGIDQLVRDAEQGALTSGIHVLYVSPLKALGNDVQKNLLEPLAGIRALAGDGFPEILTAVRTGDTPSHERAAMVRKPPHILITTPESLYLLLQHQGIADALRSVRTVIVDEVHAVCENKRGVHLAVSLERLQAHADGPLQRIGCSATLHPLEKIAAYLVGSEEGKQRSCTIVNAGMRKNLDVQVQAPLPDFLEASNTALWSSTYELLLEEMQRHRTTLIFANSRYYAERTALRLNELADDDVTIGTHHGSMAREIRLETEEALKSGRLNALVATSSLELGIDIGSVDIVYQLKSPLTVTSALQRVGRAGHLLHATSKGRILIFSRDELAEAAVICKSMYAGEVDAVQIPQGCLDVLAQQIAGAVASRVWQTDELFTLVTRAYPYQSLTRDEFDQVLKMLAGEYDFRMAKAPKPLLWWDRVTGMLTPTPSTAHVTAMCVGAIPEPYDYEVVINGTKKRVGTVHETFADDNIRIGDVFVLGSTNWRTVGKQRNHILVEEAPGTTPTVPWWMGTVDSRSREVGRGVGKLRRQIVERLGDPEICDWLQQDYHLCPNAATALTSYIREQQQVAGIVPDDRRLLVETWRDELGNTNVIVHSPYGRRTNDTWGLAIATAAKEQFRQDWAVFSTNDLLLLTLRKTDVPPLHEVTAEMLLGLVTPEMLPDLIRRTHSQAISAGSGFKDTAVFALQILRAWQGKRVAQWLLSIRAEELFEAAKNSLSYPVNIELMRQYEQSLDVEGVLDLLTGVENGEVTLTFSQVESPSPFAHELLVRSAYSDNYMMDRDKRAHLLRLHREMLQQVLSSEQMAQLLDPRAIERLENRLLHQSEGTKARSADELAHVLRELGDLPATLEAVQAVVDGDAAEFLHILFEGKRVVAVQLPDVEQDGIRLIPTDLWSQYAGAFSRHSESLQLLLPKVEDNKIVFASTSNPRKIVPSEFLAPLPSEESRECVISRYLRCHGLVSTYDIMNTTGWPIGLVERLLATLVEQGLAVTGVYTNTKPVPQFADKVNLEEIHQLTLGYLKHELSSCEAHEVVDFITRWQHVHPNTRLQGVEGLRKVIGQLQGVEVPQGALETEVLPKRVADYEPDMLDQLIASGEVCWRRVGTESIRRGMLTLCIRKDMKWLAMGAPPKYDTGKEADVDIAADILTVREYFRKHGPSYFDDVLEATAVEEGNALRALWHLVWCGELTCDTYECLRHAGFEATLSACYDLMHRPEHIGTKDSHARVVARMNKRRMDPRLGSWRPTERLCPPLQPLPEVDVTRRWARLLLQRWGIVSRDILMSEDAAPPWPVLRQEFARMELLGEVQRGYFITDHQGEQYGLPEAIELLRECRARRSEDHGRRYLPDEPIFTISLHDPANLYSTCLDMRNEDGEIVPRSRALTLDTARMIMQAGQPLLLASCHQIVQLTANQLSRCIKSLQTNTLGEMVPTSISDWNSLPIDLHPVARLLWDIGFRMHKGEMCFPPPKDAQSECPSVTSPDAFPPYNRDYLELDFGPNWLLSRAPETIRPLLSAVLKKIQQEIEGQEGWELKWTHDGPKAWYHGVGCLRLRYGHESVEFTIRPPGVTDFGKTCPYQDWGRLTCLEDLNDEFMEKIRVRRTCAIASIDRYLAKRR